MRTRTAVGAVAAAVTATSVAYVLDPAGAGGAAFALMDLAATIAMVLGPLARRARPRVAWRLMSLCGALFLVSLLIRLGVPMPAPVASPDLWAFGGYAAMAGWLAILVQRSGRAADRTVWLDTAVVTVGMAVVFWTLNVEPALHADRQDLRALLVAAMYPVMDVTLLSLAVHLALRRPHRGTALWAFLLGVLCVLVGDIAYIFVWDTRPGAQVPLINVSYLLAYAFIAVGAGHPSLRELGDAAPAGAPHELGNERQALLLLMLAPAALPLATPAGSTGTRVVRALLMLTLLALLYTRAVRTARAAVRAEAAMRFRSSHDTLTGLANREAFLARTETALAGIAGRLTVVLLGCDAFEQVNDTWGYQAGDEVLVQVAERLRAALPDGACLARVSGAEFLALLHTATPEASTPAVEAALATFGEPFTVAQGQQVHLTATAGVAGTDPSEPVTASELVRNAVVAMHAAKAGRQGTWVPFTQALLDDVSERMLLAKALRMALDLGQIEVHLQPIYGGPGFTVLTGWEALARWRTPDGMIPPDRFIPVAEDSELIIPIGEFVLRQSCHGLAQLRARSGRDDLHVSVNVSPAQILRSDMPALVADVLAETGLPADALWLEITESLAVDQESGAVAQLEALSALGVTLCLDDFGTGYSSLSYLMDLPMDIVKVDRSFINHLLTDERATALTRTIVRIADDLRMSGVVAEGVETQEQADLLAALGCSYVQGWLFGRPTPLADVEVPAVVPAVTPSASAG